MFWVAGKSQCLTCHSCHTFRSLEEEIKEMGMTLSWKIATSKLNVFYLFKCFIPKKGEQEEIHFRLISQAIFVMIMVYLLRQGNYFLNAFPFFVMMYYFNWKNYKLSVKDK